MGFGARQENRVPKFNNDIGKKLVLNKRRIKMAKAPTKEQFKILLTQEIISWDKRINELEGELKEQAVGRKLETEWLLSVFDGKTEIPKIK